MNPHSHTLFFPIFTVTRTGFESCPPVRPCLPKSCLPGTCLAHNPLRYTSHHLTFLKRILSSLAWDSAPIQCLWKLEDGEDFHERKDFVQLATSLEVKNTTYTLVLKLIVQISMTSLTSMNFKILANWPHLLNVWKTISSTWLILGPAYLYFIRF